ncbi:MAG TPA: hypothetical protein VE991_10570 [Acidimicrobiales bacterium]|nr:hypothetical protein [Acidimicrobiales bacterium]
MAKQHKYARASATVKTRLDASTIAEVAEQAAKQAESIQVMVRLEESAPGRLVYSSRNRVVGGVVEFMTFEVTMKENADGRVVSTRILRYKQKRQWLIVIPLPWQMVAWGTYKKFMYGFVNGIKAQDSQAATKVVELAMA